VVSPKIRSLVKEFTRFCNDNKAIVNPYFSLHSHADRVINKNGCPCVPERKQCPCPESIEELKAEGICKCKVFMTAGYYFKLIKKLSEG